MLVKTHPHVQVNLSPKYSKSRKQWQSRQHSGQFKHCRVKMLQIMQSLTLCLILVCFVITSVLFCPMQSVVNYTVVRDSPTYEYFLNMAGAENELYNKWKVSNRPLDTVGWVEFCIGKTWYMLLWWVKLCETPVANQIFVKLLHCFPSRHLREK